MYVGVANRIANIQAAGFHMVSFDQRQRSMGQGHRNPDTAEVDWGLTGIGAVQAKYEQPAVQQKPTSKTGKECIVVRDGIQLLLVLNISPTSAVLLCFCL